MIKTVLAKGHYSVFLASFALAAYIIALLFFNFYSHTERNQFALNQLTTDLEKRADALSYFFSERKDDMESLAAAREISNFFANQALGMSMEYGLKASLIGITGLFSRALEQKKIKNDYIYQWITLVDQGGEILASARGGSPFLSTADFQRFLEPTTSAPSISIEKLNDQVQLFISVPFLHKGQIRGQIIAGIDFPSPLMHFVDASPAHSLTHTCIATSDGCIHHAFSEPSWFHNLPYGFLRTNSPRTIAIATDETPSLEAIIIKSAVDGTPFFTITLIPTSEIYGSIAPAQLILAMGLLAALILCGVVLGIRVNTENLVLHARYEESEKQQHTLELRNLQLQQEIGRRQQGEQLLNHLAHHDPLTNLPNKLLLQERLKHALRSADRQGGMAAVLFLDLDRFKNVNDTLGHPAGDELLRATAERLATCLRGEDTIARLGGDEFIVILELIEDAREAAKIAQELLDVLARPFRIYDREVFITASIGISLYPSHGNSPTDMVMHADAAMYRAKALGRNGYHFYSVELTAAALERFSLENSLRRALDREELRLHYQPQFSFRTGEIIGVEALLRWEHPEMGLIFPSQFIPLAEETGLIEPIGEWALRGACRQAKHWGSMGLPAPRMAVNLSGKQIMNPGLLHTVTNCVAETGIEPECLELEITESSIMSDPNRAICVLRDLHDLGIGTVIDDFGTGYSSMSYLKQFDLTKIKIDRSFIRDIPHSRRDAAIIKAIITLGHSLSVTINGEGVESEEQLSFLQTWGCDEWQGYLFSKPVSADDIEELIGDVDFSPMPEKPHDNVVDFRQSRIL